MCRLASEKDRGFSPVVLAEMLGSFERFSAEDLGVDEPARRELSGVVQEWRRQLSDLTPRLAHRADEGPDLSP